MPLKKKETLIFTLFTPSLQWAKNIIGSLKQKKKNLLDYLHLFLFY